MIWVRTQTEELVECSKIRPIETYGYQNEHAYKIVNQDRDVLGVYDTKERTLEIVISIWSYIAYVRKNSGSLDGYEMPKK